MRVLLRLSTTCVRPGSDFCAGARSSRQSRPSGVVEHVRSDAIDASSLWRVLLDGVEGKQLSGLLASAAAPRGAALVRCATTSVVRVLSAPGPARRSRTDRPETRDYVMRPPRLVGAGPASAPRAVCRRLPGHRRRPSAPAPAQKTGLPKRKPTLPLTPREVSLSHAHLCRRKTGAQPRRHRNA